MDEINDNTENMRQIQDLLSAPMGAAADFDEVSLSLSLSPSLPPSLPTYGHTCVFLLNLFCFE